MCEQFELHFDQPRNWHPSKGGTLMGGTETQNQMTQARGVRNRGVRKLIFQSKYGGYADRGTEFVLSMGGYAKIFSKISKMKDGI